MKKRLLAFVLAAGVVFSACSSDGSGGGKADPANPTGEATGYTFESDGTEVAVGLKAEPVMDSLGEPLSYYEAESCAFGDLDKVWTYNDFTIYTYQTDDVDYIYDIVLSNDAVSTPEGISIGASADEVKEAYGDPESEDSSQLVYRKGDMRLIFLLGDDKVTSIDYQSTILE